MLYRHSHDVELRCLYLRRRWIAEPWLRLAGLSIGLLRESQMLLCNQLDGFLRLDDAFLGELEGAILVLLGLE